MKLLAFDVGGTFIDLLVFDSDTRDVTVYKADSSRGLLGAAIETGVATLLKTAVTSADDIARVAHGTTVVTNQIVERNGARVGLVTTKGFRDVLEIGRMRRTSLSSLGDDRPAALVERPMRLEIAERVLASGDVERIADASEARRVVEDLIEQGAEAIAVCTLNAYANGTNEDVVAQVCGEGQLPVSTSSSVAAEFGEFERCATTVLNSYVMPSTREYLRDIEERLRGRGITAPLEIMQSSGGVVPAQVAGEYPVRLVGSGPSAGVAAAAQIGQAIECPKLVTLDMGGTSADVSIVVDGVPRVTSEHDIGGLPVRAVGVDVRSIGAGGGSIASLDRTGSLQVGPASAGADPGPACYGRGGEEPTVTDADVVLGYLDPSRFCAGTRPLSVTAARQALETISDPTGTTVEEVALGIVRIAVTRMAGAIRTITTQAGYDPRDCTLVAFGGAGPTHAAWVARELEMPEVLIPLEPALLSARGLLMADYRTDVYRTMVSRLADVSLDGVNRALASLASDARAHLSSTDLSGSDVAIAYILEVCYEGQQDLIPIPVDGVPLRETGLSLVAEALDEHFMSRYGFLPPDRLPVLRRLRVTATAQLPRPPMDIREQRQRAKPQALPSRAAYVTHTSGEPESVRVVRREAITATEVAGPCIVEEDYASTIVLAGETVWCDAVGNLHIGLRKGAGGQAT